MIFRFGIKRIKRLPSKQRRELIKSIEREKDKETERERERERENMWIFEFKRSIA